MIMQGRWTVWDDLNCFGHTIQLCIKHCPDISAVSKLIARARKIVGHFKHSTTVMAKWENAKNSLSYHSTNLSRMLQQDGIPHRWTPVRRAACRYRRDARHENDKEKWCSHIIKGSRMGHHVWMWQFTCVLKRMFQVPLCISLFVNYIRNT
jgi:hypothetical protein